MSLARFFLISRDYLHQHSKHFKNVHGNKKSLNPIGKIYAITLPDALHITNYYTGNRVNESNAFIDPTSPFSIRVTIFK